jgi:hypothetical protein
MFNAMSFHLGLIQFAAPLNPPLDYPHKPNIIQLRSGGNQLRVNAKRRHNARINRRAINVEFKSRTIASPVE